MSEPFDRARAEYVAGHLVNNFFPFSPEAEHPHVEPVRTPDGDLTHYRVSVADDQLLCSVPATTSDGESNESLAHAIANAGPLLVSAMRALDAAHAEVRDLAWYRDTSESRRLESWRDRTADIPTRAMWDEATATIDLIAQALGLEMEGPDAPVIARATAIAVENARLRVIEEIVREQHEDCEQAANHRANPRTSGRCVMCDAIRGGA